MSMGAQKRKPLSVMIGLMAPKGARGPGRDEPDGDEEGDEDYQDSRADRPDEGELAACQDVIDAMAKRDPQRLSEALHHWMELAGYGRSDEG